MRAHSNNAPTRGSRSLSHDMRIAYMALGFEEVRRSIRLRDVAGAVVFVAGIFAVLIAVRSLVIALA